MARHIAATVISATALVTLWLLIYALNPVAEFIEPPIAGCFWIIRIITVATVVFLPISIWAHSVLVEERHCPWWKHTVFLSAIFFVVNLILTEVFALAMTGQLANTTALMILSLQDSFWGVVYWWVFLFIGIRRNAAVDPE